MWRWLTVAAAAAAAALPAAVGSRGYSLALTQPDSVVGLKKGVVDFEDTGFDQIDSEISISMWMRIYSEGPGGYQITLSWSHDENPTLLQPWSIYPGWVHHLVGYRGFGFAAMLAFEWHHFACTLSADGLFKSYLDGQLVAQDDQGQSLPLRGTRTTFTIGGALLHSPSAIVPELNPSKAMVGEMDDLTVWSRALDQEEIQDLMNQPLNVSALPTEAVLAFNFDVEHCAQTSDPECGTDQDVIRNYGSAGRDYDMILGMLNYGPSGPSSAYKSVFDSANGGATRTMTRPVLHRCSVPLANNAFTPSAPTVLEGLPGDTIEVPLQYGDFAAARVASIPSNGSLTITGAGGRAPAALDDNLTNATALQYELAADELVVAFTLKLQHADSRVVLHHIHVLPLKRPVAKSSVDMLGVEDGMLRLVAARQGSVPSGERAFAVLATLPKLGSIFNLDFSPKTRSIGIYTEALEPGSVITDFASGLALVPYPDVFGAKVDSFQIFLRSELTGLESDPVTVHVTLLHQDDLPQGEPAASRVAEDSTAGVSITLAATDAEGKAGVVIAQLPRHGRLFVEYTRAGQKPEEREITEPYEVFNVGEDLLEQYVEKVRAVSSYWGNGLITSYNAVNVIGSPHCQRQGQSECAGDDHFAPSDPSPILVGDLVRGQLDLLGEDASGDPATLIFYRVVAVHNKTVESDLGATFDLVEEPLFRRHYDAEGNVTHVRCRLVNSTYPGGCVVLPAGAPLLGASQVARNALHSMPNSVWCPATRSGDAPFVSDEITELFGPAYASVHDPSASYNDRDPSKLRAYTEFIEVDYAEPVFPVSVQVGQPRGPGTIVAVYALHPITDEWVLMFSGAPQENLGAESVSGGLYHVFHENQCREPFRTRSLRLEIDTVTISDWNYIDYIKLIGAKEIQSAMLTNGVSQVRYVPNPDAFGEDKFYFQVSDCGGNALRLSEPVGVTVQIDSVPDAPRVSVLPAPNIYAYSEDSYFRQTQDRMPFTLRADDPDDEEVHVEWVSLPTLGTVRYRGGSDGSGGSGTEPDFDFVIEPLSASSPKRLARAAPGQALRLPLSFEPVRCTDKGVQLPGGEWAFLAKDYFEVRVVDSSGAAVPYRVNFTVACEDYGFDFAIDTAVMGLLGCNLIAGVSAVVWTLATRRSPIVRAAQVPFLLLIAIGSMLSSSSIYPLTMHDQNGPRADEEGGNAEADMGCRLAASLFMMGYMLSFSALFAKMYRVYMLFSEATSFGTETSKTDLSTRGIMRIVFAFCSMELALVVAWLTVDPLTYRRYVTQRDLHGNPIVSGGFCFSLESTKFIGIACAFHVLVLCIGASLCYKTMGMSSAFSEAKYVSVAIIGNLEVLLIAIPVLLIVSDSPSSSLFVQSGVIALNDLGILLFIFGPKVYFHLMSYVESGAGADALMYKVKSASKNQSRVSAAPQPTPSTVTSKKS